MSWRNTKISYGIVAKSLHWLMAILIITAWIIGYYAMEMLPENAPSRGEYFGIHKSIGMLLLMLLAVRFSWRVYNSVPRVSSNNKIIVTAAHTVHYLLYLNIFVQIMSGWAMSSAAGHPPGFFGMFYFPSLVSVNYSILPELVGIHNSSAIVLLVLFVLHVCGALFHHFILKDNTIRKMTVD